MSAPSTAQTLFDLWAAVQARDTAAFKTALADFNNSKEKKASLLNEKDEFGNTLIHTAIIMGLVEVAKTLLGAGVSLDVTDSNGHPPFLASVVRNRFDIARALLAERPKNLNASFADHQGRTCLHFASAKGEREIIEMLLELGADINAACNRGWTALHYATGANKPIIVEYLVMKGANINAASLEGSTALHISSLYGFDTITTLLVEKFGAFANAKTMEGQTPLHNALKSLNQPAVRVLVEQDADIESVDSFGHTPMQLTGGNRSLTKILTGTPSKVATVAANSEILEECPYHIANRSMGFVVQSRDKYSRARPRGGSNFTVSIKQQLQTDAQLDHKVIDLKNGQYQVIWRTDTPATYKVSVQLGGEEIKGSPVETVVQPADEAFDDRVPTGPSTVRIQLTPSHRSKRKSAEIFRANSTANFPMAFRDAPPSPLLSTASSINVGDISNRFMSDSAIATRDTRGASSLSDIRTTKTSPHLSPGDAQPKSKVHRKSDNSKKRRTSTSSEASDEPAAPADGSTTPTAEPPELTRKTTVFSPFRALSKSSSSEDAGSSATTPRPEEEESVFSNKIGTRSRGISMQEEDPAEPLRREAAFLAAKIAELEAANRELKTSFDDSQEKVQKLAKICSQERKNQRCLNCSQLRDAILNPCLHFAYCLQCAEELSACPICQTALKTPLQVKFPPAAE